jgi:hypothetical protein
MKHLKYLQYVIRHKWYVLVECCKLGIPLRGLIHDWSKFLPDEWFPYAFYFYGDPAKQNEEWFILSAKYGCFEAAPYGTHYEDKFKIAWNHHQKRNDHHWQYWVLMLDDGGSMPMPMSGAARREMLADWRGAGRAITGQDNTPEWYLKNQFNIRLFGDTRNWIEEQLGVAERAEEARIVHVFAKHGLPVPPG